MITNNTGMALIGVVLLIAAAIGVFIATIVIAAALSPVIIGTFIVTFAIGYLNTKRTKQGKK